MEGQLTCSWQACGQGKRQRQRHARPLHTATSLLVSASFVHTTLLPVRPPTKQQERDELRQLLLERVSEEESQALRSASQDLSRSHASKRIFESARLKAIQRAKGRKRKDLVLALERFSWTDFQQTQG